MSYYQRHVFFCCNQREAPEACCANHGSTDLQAYAKGRVKALGLNGRARSASTRPAASTAATRDRCSSSIPKPSGTRTSTAPTSTRSSSGTSSAAKSSRGCAFDAQDDRALHDRRSRRRAGDRVRTSLRTRPAASRWSRIRTRCRAARSTTRSRRRSRRHSSRWATPRPRFNFRGVGRSQGAFDDGVGETADALAALAHARANRPRAARRARRLFVRHLRADARRAVDRRRAPGAGRSRGAALRARGRVRRTTIVVHGEEDEIVPLADVLAWARPQAAARRRLSGLRPLLPRAPAATAAHDHGHVARPCDRPRRLTRPCRSPPPRATPRRRTSCCGSRGAQALRRKRGGAGALVRDPSRRMLRPARARTAPARPRRCAAASGSSTPTAARSNWSASRCRDAARQRAHPRGGRPAARQSRPDFTVTENLQVYGRYFGIAHAKLAARIPALLDFAGLAGTRRRRASGRCPAA